MNAKNTYLILVSFLVLSCSGPKKPAAPSAGDRAQMAQRDSFARFYADMLLLSNDTSRVSRDTLALRHTTDSLYQAYGLDSLKARNLLESYGSDQETWKAFFEKVIARLVEIQQTGRKQNPF